MYFLIIRKWNQKYFVLNDSGNLSKNTRLYCWLRSIFFFLKASRAKELCMYRWYTVKSTVFFSCYSLICKKQSVNLDIFTRMQHRQIVFFRVLFIYIFTHLLIWHWRFFSLLIRFGDVLRETSIASVRQEARSIFGAQFLLVNKNHLSSLRSSSLWDI